jgi:Mg2+-importing ATPase
VTRDAELPSDLWGRPIAETLSRLHTDTIGLASDEAAGRLAGYGPNRLQERPRRYLLIGFVSRFRNPLVLILLAAAAVSAVTHEQASFTIIAAIVLLSVTLDFVQEHRAEAAADRLRERVALRVTALRDGKPREIPAADIVPGDVILLAAGDLVPADSRLIESKDLFVNEALLTGEPYPAEKHARDRLEVGEQEAAAPVNGVLMGSSVVSGTAKAIVVATGRATLQRASP